MTTLKRSIEISTLIFILLIAIAFSFVPSRAVALGSSKPSFTKPINLSNDSSVAQFPNVQSNGKHVYVAWTENLNGIKFRSSANSGKTWGAVLTLSKSLVGSAQDPLISDNGSNVYVVWSQGTGSSIEVYVAHSTNFGANFSAPIPATSGAGPFVTPVIASWGASVYVAYINNTGALSAFVSCSSDLGVTWTNPMYVGDREPQVAAWGGKYVYVAADWNISVSADNCQSWTSHAPQDWSKGVLIPKEPWIAASGTDVYVVWETGGSNSVVRSVISNDSGADWTQPVNLTNKIPDGWAPMVSAQGDSAWVAFREYPGGAKGQVWVLSSRNNGSTWAPTSLSGKGASGSAETFPYAVVSSDGQNVFVGWSHQVKSGYWTFVVSYSNNGGISWSPAPGLTVSTNSKGESGYENDIATGSIAASGTHCFAVWQYTNGASDQIYFTHS